MSGKMLFGLRLSRVKCSQVMLMGKFGPTALNFREDFFFFQFYNLFWDTLCRLLHKANFQNGNSSFRDFCCRMNPILRVASRDLEADGGGLWKCNLFMSARTFGIWKKVSTFLKWNLFILIISLMIGDY